MERYEIEQKADEIIAKYDEVYFEVMNRILDEVRAETNNPHESTPSNLAQVALTELGLPRISEI